jgi:hypothetical protein
LALRLAAVAVAAAALAAAGQAAAPRPYWFGSTFEGLDAERGADPSTPTWIYGKCVPAPDAGCLPPLQVQNWSLSRRHPNRYVRAIKCVRGTIKRVPAAVFETTGGLEIYAGRTVIYIVGRKTAQVMRSVRALRPHGAGRLTIRLAAPPASVPKALRRCRRGNLQQALEAVA